MRACAVLAGNSMQELLQKASDAKGRGADLVEVCFDQLNGYEDIELIESFPLPVIVSCRYSKDKTLYSALKKSLKFKTEFVDIDLSFPKSFIEEIFSYARSNGIKTIVSYYPETLPAQKTLKKVIEDMSILSNHIKITLPAKSGKNFEAFDETFGTSSKTGAKLTLISSMHAIADRRNFIGYGKTDSSSNNRHLPHIEDVKKLIVENTRPRA
ncbi:MAG: type I 3-dehydroquinate dehydratase [Candidatus Aenigmarchaeota archaeon]|nr:type I 3-dehydroquinate dehydratase [Candidatus Aenigmarchaeota archaeon]